MKLLHWMLKKQTIDALAIKVEILYIGTVKKIHWSRKDQFWQVTGFRLKAIIIIVVV